MYDQAPPKPSPPFRELGGGVRISAATETMSCALLRNMWGDVAQEVRAEGCQFDPTLGVSKCP